MPASSEIVETARTIADGTLFPAAIAVDGSDEIPRGHLDRLAEAGLYGVAGPVEAGGLGLELPEFCAVVETLAGGCLATAFVWVQHHGLVRAVAGGPPELRAEWLAPLCRGERRAGIALTGAMPGPARLRARPAEGGGWLLSGTAPWVTGWGGLDALLVVARGPDETLVSVLLDAAERPGLVARRQRLVAVDASATVELDFADVPVDAGRVLAVEPYQPNYAGAALRVNGSLALGVIARCCRLIGPSPLDAQLADRRQALDDALAEATADRMLAARAAAAELALRAAAATVVHAGSRSLRTDQHPQRLAREATFLLVFATRPPIRTALLTHLTTP